MADCIFCKIVAKEIPNHTVFEDKSVLAFLDIHPLAKGHTVIVPKWHAETLFDLSVQQLTDFFAGVRNAMQRARSVLRPDGFNVGLNHGNAGGQAVPHLHMHIIPRWVGDGGGSMHSIVCSSSDEPVAAVAQLFH